MHLHSWLCWLGQVLGRHPSLKVLPSVWEAKDVWLMSCTWMSAVTAVFAAESVSCTWLSAVFAPEYCFLYLLLLSAPIRRQLTNGLACISLNWLYANAFQYCLQCSWWTWHDQKLYLTSKWVKVNHWWITSQSVIGCFIPCRLRPSLLLSWVAVLWCRLM